MSWRGAARWAGWGLVTVVMLLILAGTGVYLYLDTSVAQTDGTMRLPGLLAPVTVSRDRYGIPTIRAQDQHDADFALGFVHAQDRLFQMEMLRRYGEGRIAAWAGKSQLPRDELMRTIGIERAAKADFKGLSRPVRAALEAYAEGVNAYIEHHSGSSTLYYYFVPGPRKWHAIDTLVIAKVLAYYLTQNFRKELLHAAIAARVSGKQLAELYPSYPKRGLITLAALAPIYRGMRLGRLARLLPPAINEDRASNNWVLAGIHTTSGKPILANDPHMLFSTPSLWYLARVITPHHDISGAMIPGAPLFVVGHNRHIGWGMTETGTDVEDLFIEKVDPNNPKLYLTPQGWEPFRTRRERIRVSGGNAVTITVRSTRHGPVISDVMSEAERVAPKGSYVLALQATWLQPNDKTIEALWEMDRARNWQEFKQAARGYVAPMMNIVFASADGTIAFIAPGRVPIRKSGEGWVPHPGWSGKYDWIGYIPFGDLPRSVDPPSGRFISANNKIVANDYPFFLTSNWAAPYRADRIAQLLDRKPMQSIASTAAIQADRVSLAARQLLPLLLHARPLDLRSGTALRLLKSWNGDMRANLAAPLIFTAWLREFERELFKPKLGPDFAKYWKPRATVVLDLLQYGNNAWCEPPPSNAARSCATVLSHSLEQAMKRLADKLGASVSNWRWGEEHKADFWSIASRAPLIGSWFSMTPRIGGGNYTIDAGYTKFEKKHPYWARTGPGLRMILNFANLDRSLFVIAPGMSGNPLSAHYADLLPRWRRFEYVTLGHAAAVHRLTLTP